MSSPKDEAPAATSASRTRSGLAARAATVVGLAIAIAGAVFVARSLADSWAQVEASLRSAEWWWLLPAIALSSLAMTSIGLVWGRALTLLGARLSVGRVLIAYYLGQLGKYVPGGIWPVIGRGELLRRQGVARPLAYGSVGLSLATTYIAAGLVALALLPLQLARDGSPDAVVWLLVLPAGLVALHPRFLRWFVRIVDRILSRETAIVVPAWRSSVAMVLLLAPAWIGIAMSTWFVALALDSSVTFDDVAFAAVVSWIAGFLAVPVPGGIGVREAVFVAAAGGMSPGVAATVAVLSRVVAMVVDAGGAGVAAVAARSRRFSAERAIGADVVS